jgi:hypothetical protein
MKLATSGVDSMVVVWVRELLVGHTERVRVGGKLYNEVKIISVVLKATVSGQLLFLVYVNYIWRNNDSRKRLFAANCIIYRKISNKNNTQILQ